MTDTVDVQVSETVELAHTPATEIASEEPCASQENAETNATPLENAECSNQSEEADEVARPVVPVDIQASAETDEDATQQDIVEASAPLVIEEPIFSGLLAYRKASGTFPIYHKRWFYFTKDATPLERLHAFYDKYKRLKVDKDELDQLVAHAATTGKGLFFLSRTAESVPCGIIECQRIVDIRPDENMADKFSISYGSKQVFYFETAASSRDAWIAGITQMKRESDKEIENIRASSDYLKHLEALKDGVAFNRASTPIGTNDVLSEDETTVTSPATAATGIIEAVEEAQQPVPEKTETSKSKRASIFFQTLKDKIPHEKVVEEMSTETVVEVEKTPKKDKRKSFLANFMSKKDLSALKSKHDTDASEMSPAPVSGELEQSAIATEALNVSPESERTDVKPSETTLTLASAPRSPLGPLKTRVDGFFSKVKKITEKESREVVGATGTSAEITPVLQESSVEESVVANPSSEATMEAVTPMADTEASLIAVADHVDQVAPADAAVAPSIAAGPVESSELAVVEAADEQASNCDSGTTAVQKRPASLARKLTSLFRHRKPVKVDESSTPAVTSEPPQLPETAKVDMESAEPLSDALQKADAVAGPEIPQPSAPNGSATLQSASKA